MMPLVRDYSITRKLAWINMLVSAAALLVACVSFITYETVIYRQGMVRNLSVQAQMIGSNSVSAVLFNDEPSVENTLSALRPSVHVVTAWIYTPDGKPFAGYWRDNTKGAPQLAEYPHDTEDVSWFAEGRLNLVHPVYFQQKLTAIIYIQSDLNGLYERRQRFAEIGCGVLFVCLIAAFLVSWVLRGAIAKPIQNLAQVAKNISLDKNYAVRAALPSGKDEISDLVNAFNTMLAQIQQRDAELQKVQDLLEIRVNERTAELEATNKELEAFTYSVSHDLRAPLRRIDGFSKLFLDETSSADLSEDARRFITYIRQGAQEMGELVDDLLNLSRVARKELNVQVTGLDSLVESVVADLKRDNPGRPIEWSIHSLPFVECDPTLMRQVFINLISNAVKYSRPRDPAVIEVGATKKDGEQLIYVKDNGVGFSMKYVNKLFGVFQRLHRPEDFEGTGVGLATVQRIIHKHGGRVWAEAILDEGATFYFSIPVQNNGA